MAGIPINQFWEMTPYEIYISARAEQERQIDFYRAMASMIYTGATLVSIGINDPKKFPSINNAFPGLFEPEKQQDWRIMKEKINDFAFVSNKERGT